MKAVFTICAKNYLSHARTLGDSIKKIHPDIDFSILLSDEVDGFIDLQKEKHRIVEFKTIEREIYKDLAFKYDVLEFSTSVKPFYFHYLFKHEKYDKVIYLDPDIYVYNSLDYVFNLLDDNFLILTPHFTRMDLNDSGPIREETILFVGIYNLGFAAFSNKPEALQVIEWWKKRLQDKCYVDRENALHVDQKWMDLIPSYFNSGVHITRHTGLNISHCNMHQRKLTKDKQTYLVDGKPLIFFHFTGFDPKNPDSITKPGRQTTVTLKDMPEYKDIFYDYAKCLYNNNYEKISKSTYFYNNFENGINIFQFQRRYYRAINLKFDNPFSISEGSFYNKLQKNGLIINEKKQVITNLRGKELAGFDRKKRMLINGLYLLKKLFGIKNYILLMSFLKANSDPEKQLFVFKNEVKK